MSWEVCNLLCVELAIRSLISLLWPRLFPNCLIRPCPGNRVFLSVSAFACSLLSFWLPGPLSEDLPSLWSFTFWIILSLDYCPMNFPSNGLKWTCFHSLITQHPSFTPLGGNLSSWTDKSCTDVLVCAFAFMKVTHHLLNAQSSNLWWRLKSSIRVSLAIEAQWDGHFRTMLARTWSMSYSIASSLIPLINIFFNLI